MAKKKNEKKKYIDQEVMFEGARVALPVFVDEYSKECDRKSVIENKITTLITIEVAILTVFIPIIPFDNIKTYLFGVYNSITIATTIACFLLVIGITLMSISFVVLMKAIGIQTYSKVDIVQLQDNLNFDANSVEKGLCDHYKSIIYENSNLNDKKANEYKVCLPITVVAFFILALGTILLKIL